MAVFPTISATGAVAATVAAGPKLLATSALGLGATYDQATGRSLLTFDAVAEIAHASLETPKVFDIANGIHLHAVVNLIANGDAAAFDLDIGLVNVLDATVRANLDDASATRLASFHIDGGALSLLVQSDNNVVDTGHVDTTLDLVEGTAVTLDIIALPTGVVEFYVNGARVLSTTAFSIGDSAADFYGFILMEKTNDDTAAQLAVSEFEVLGST